jgi:ABC-type antimicrobial peptide transport system permease subunit
VTPGLAVPELGSLTTNLRTAVAPRRFNALLLGVLAAAGLLLALVGVYGVSQRIREIGIRLALGGEPSSILRMVMRQSLRLAILGAATGALLSWEGGRWLAGLLYRTEPTDPLTWLAVPVLLLTSCLLAAWLPARRATRVDPREALAGE